ncbi:MAG: ABC transporter ATP-binding protein [Actinomycetota bacterium]|nr:ABC transporter ATP-binding protein [Actinomycetota bacterium]
MARLLSEKVNLSYGDSQVVHDLSITIPDGQITTIIGPNGCGKSTLLKSLARLLKPTGGSVLLDGQVIHHYPTREVAKRLGLLSQQAVIVPGISVADLVRRGRYPHQAFMQPPSKEDEIAVDHALELTGMQELRDRPVDRLSGGQRQRAWIAMAIAQDTPLLLLDEPTTFLDISHQLEVVDLVQKLNREDGRTVVMVLHDINEAARASDHIVAMHDGRIIHEGPPSEVINPTVLWDTYGVECDVYPHPVLDYPYCVPHSCQTQATEAVPAQGDGFQVNGIDTGYGKHIVLENLSVEIEAGRVTSIIGPNACGKSTLVRTCARLLKPNKGKVHLGEDQVHRGSHRKFARRLALLAQGQMPPSGFLVEDLVASGRIPHQGLFRQWSSEDESIVNDALERANLTGMRFREVDTLSGGQRQRCWFAMCLAQNTPVILLDEPTTFLDISAQLDMLDMAHRLNREEGRTVVMILHDLNMAARYSDTIIAMKHGRVMATGSPRDVLTPEILREVFEIEAQVTTDPNTGCPVVIPIDSVNTASELDQIPSFEGLATAAIPAD